MKMFVTKEPTMSPEGTTKNRNDIDIKGRSEKIVVTTSVVPHGRGKQTTKVVTTNLQSARTSIFHSFRDAAACPVGYDRRPAA